MAEFKDNLKELRVGDARTMYWVAYNTDLTISAISQFEHGKRSPSISSLIKIADLFKVTTDYLLGRSPTPKRYKSFIISGDFTMRKID